MRLFPIYAIGLLLFISCGQVKQPEGSDDSYDETAVESLRNIPLTEIVLGVYERSVGETTAHDLQPLIDFLEKKTKYDYKVLVYPEVDDLVAGMREGLVNLGIFTPMTYVQARKLLPGIQPLVTATQQSSPTYVGYLVVNEKNQAETLPDLKGKTVVYVSKDSTSGFLYPRSLIKSWGFDPNKFFKNERFAGTHSLVIEQVVADSSLVGAVGQGFVDESSLLRHSEAAQLKVVAKTARIPFDCVAATNRLPYEARSNIRAALVSIDDDLEVSKELRFRWGYDGFVLSSNQRYDAVAQQFDP
ncbi:MAG: phosphate/phosphite/phosphonate ABC transporter substrate-binding protein [Myxococcales bacterium]|nr:MAG: phosphate/phosphite/phosphonate ABC transporter substrate-binding protein [Myxococcales bacterium]